MTTSSKRLQVGGTLNPRRHVYIERPEDAELLRLLLEGEYCNILTSRQMGKSSLMARTALKLMEEGRRFVAVDVAGELGGTARPEPWYLGLLDKIVRDLQLGISVEQWWYEQPAGTHNRKLLGFFREEVIPRLDEPVVVFLDEIDSTLRLPFTDDLFTALRTLHNERALVPAYERITFCLLGVATPNELVKDRRTTAYNIGRSLELRDFDPDRDDLSLLGKALSEDPGRANEVLARILYWTGGHPYLTLKFCDELRGKAKSAADVDDWTARAFASLDQLDSDVHFQQILRFLETRLYDGRETFRLYAAILQGVDEHDQATLPHTQLKLSGLVKRDSSGCLVVRNELYGKLFNRDWVLYIQQLSQSQGTLALKGDPTTHRVGNYRIDKLLGSGALGEVYNAWDERLARTVAIRRIWTDAMSTPEQRRKLRRVALRASRLHHGAIARILDLVATGSDDWIVFEMAEGKTFDQALASRPFTMAEVLRILAQIAAGLSAAHEYGLVHGSLKTRNLMVDSSDRAKILDLGLADDLVATRELNPGTTGPSSSRVEIDGVIVGSILSIAPEQIADETADARSDLFAFGCILYEVFTGRPPFFAPGLHSTLFKLMNERQPPAIERFPKMPEELSQWIDRLLEKDPELRPQTAREVQELLEDLAKEVDPKLRIPPPFQVSASDLHAASESASKQAEESSSTMIFTVGTPDTQRSRHLLGVAILLLALALWVLIFWGLLSR